MKKIKSPAIRFIVALTVFAISVIAIDVALGKLGAYLNSHAKGGDTYNHYNVVQEQAASVLVMGSSRALHHYVPEIMGDSLGLKVYNCGQDGNGIIFHYARLAMILERYQPKIVIYDAYYGYDVIQGDNTRYLQLLKRWSGEPTLDSIFLDIDVMEPIKLHSSMYRYNGSWIQMLSDNINPRQKVSDGGYKPMYDVMDYEQTDPDPGIVEWDPVKYKYFNKFIDLCQCRGVQLVVAYSPYYGRKDGRNLQCITELCEERGIPVLDFYADANYVSDKSKFADATHLNDAGAREYTSEMVGRLKKLGL